MLSQSQGPDETARVNAERRQNMRVRFGIGLICWFLLFVLGPAANAQTVNGDIDAAFAIGRWKESHEGVSLFCARVTTEKEVTKGNSNGVCFLTEAQASAKNSVL